MNPAQTGLYCSHLWVVLHRDATMVTKCDQLVDCSELCYNRFAGMKSALLSSCMTIYRIGTGEMLSICSAF